MFHRPDKTEMNKYVDLGGAPVIVKNLVTESPMQTIGKVQIQKLRKGRPEAFYYWSKVAEMAELK